MSIDERINQLLAPLTEAFAALVFFEVPILGVGVPVVVAWLVAGSVFFTLATGFVNLRGLPMAVRTLRGAFDHEDAPGEDRKSVV